MNAAPPVEAVPLRAVNVVEDDGMLPVRIGLCEDTRRRSAAALNRLLAHAMALRDLYQQARWQLAGGARGELHGLLVRHHAAQLLLIERLADRVDALGGVALALAADVLAASPIAQVPRGAEPAALQLRRLVGAHGFILSQAEPMAWQASIDSDEDTGDVIVNGLVRMNEQQSWFLAEQLVGGSCPCPDRRAAISASTTSGGR